MKTSLPKRAPANGLSAVRSSVVGIRERAVRSARAAEAGSLSLGRACPASQMNPFTFTLSFNDLLF